MTIIAQDVYTTLGSRVGHPQTRQQEIDRVVRVLNADCVCVVTARGPAVVAMPDTGRDAAPDHGTPA